MIEIRKIQKSEEASARDLVSSVMATEFSNVQSTYPMDDLNSIRDHYGSLGEAFFVAIDGEKVVGTVGVKRDDERTALLRRIFVDPTFRGKKLGYRLMQHAIDFCRMAGYQEIVFKATSEMTAANKLCIANGFQEKARIPIGPADLIKFALFLRENTALAG
jgi:GNAT superfamily N-acetyltransferase